MTSAAGRARFVPRALTARGLEYRIRVAGEEGDSTVLLLHGFAGSGEDWTPFVPALAGADGGEEEQHREHRRVPERMELARHDPAGEREVALAE